MSRRTTTLRLTVALISIVLVGQALLSGLFVLYLQRSAMRSVQQSVRLDLNSAREVYRHQADFIARFLQGAALDDGLRDGLDAACDSARMARLEDAGELDMIALLDASGQPVCCATAACSAAVTLGEDPLARQAADLGQAVSGTVILPASTLAAYDADLAERARFELIPTPAARPTEDRMRSEGMALGAAVPVLGPDGELQGLLWGARLLNRRFGIVDDIRDQVFQGRTHQGKHTGTATIFQWDLRVSTNVLDEHGERALATRLSEEVYQRVLEEGEVWDDRAFVVNDWYITAYEPIRDPDGAVIGALYVGLLEAPLLQERWSQAAVFLSIVGLTTLASLLLLVLVVRAVLRPIGQVLAMSRRVAEGDLGARVGRVPTGELGVLCQAVDTMAQAVEQRERQLRILTQQQLGQSEKLAAIGRLAAGIAHEINNPLTGVLSFAQLLAEKPHMSDEDREDLAVITAETTRIRDIVRGLLDFARESPSERAPIDLERLVQDTARLLERQKEFRQVRMVLELCGQLEPITGDENQLKQVLLNLMLNACEAMPEGGELRVRTRAGDPVLLEIRDTGHGVPPEHLDKLFDPFFTTKPPGRGTGLGLSVSYGIVQQHGGRIEVESRPGEGASFRVLLPVDPV
jgi:two-component system NtrC family sensor kinase